MSAEEKPRFTILIVDDVALNRMILADMLGDDYDLIEAENGVEALAALQQHGTEIALVLLDIVMPEMDGFDVLAAMNSHGWINEIPVIMVSSETASSTIERAYQLGVTDFVGRPFDTSIVRHRVNNTLMLYAKQNTLRGMVADQIKEREKSVGLMISILSQIVEFRNGESGLHVLHVNTLTRMLLEQLVKMGYIDLTPQEIKDITVASSLHDIGKISIPDHILNKPGRFTDEEFEIMKQHSAIGAEMLKNNPIVQDEPLIDVAYEICRWHHERWDGKGYPDGLKGEDIPISAQVVSLADVYDALTSERIYKDAYPHEKAVEMILNGECGQFNPALLEGFKAIIDDIHRELKLSSLSTNSLHESERFAKEAVSLEVEGPSNRTLDLLDYERMKFDFFAKMSNEVQFEITFDPTILQIHDWGTYKLGLPEIVMNPMEDEELLETFGIEQLEEFKALITDTTPENPVVELNMRAAVQGEPRWLQMYACSLWRENEQGEKEFSGIIGKLIDIHDSVLRLTDLENKATHDSLTGLTNHEFARHLIIERLNESAPDDTSVIMVLDVDKFKDVNDTYGHLRGDEVLTELSRALRNAVRDNDIVARVGGDEFIIFLQTKGDAGPLVDRIYKSVSQSIAPLEVTISLGAASVVGGNIDYNNFFAVADQLLYDMKRAGRNCCVLQEVDRCDIMDDGKIAGQESDGSETTVSQIDDCTEDAC